MVVVVVVVDRAFARPATSGPLYPPRPLPYLSGGLAFGGVDQLAADVVNVGLVLGKLQASLPLRL